MEKHRPRNWKEQEGSENTNKQHKDRRCRQSATWASSLLLGAGCSSQGADSSGPNAHSATGHPWPALSPTLLSARVLLIRTRPHPRTALPLNLGPGIAAARPALGSKGCVEKPGAAGSQPRSDADGKEGTRGCWTCYAEPWAPGGTGRSHTSMQSPLVSGLKKAQCN